MYEAPEFQLTPLGEQPSKKRWRLPDGVVELSIPGPAERSITICVTLKGTDGRLIEVPVAWNPKTKVIKKLHRLTWAQLGVTERLSRLRERITKIAKKEHLRLVKKSATVDLFGHEEA